LTAGRTYYVRPNGNNANNGLANTAGGAFLTVQKAIDVALREIDAKNFDVTIQLAAGTYAGFAITSAMLGTGNLTVLGDTTTPSNVIIDGGAGFAVTQTAGVTILSGLKMQGATGCVVCSGGKIKTTVRNEYAGAASGHRVIARNFGVVEASGVELISGTASGGHYLADIDGLVTSLGVTWQGTGTVTQAAFAYANGGSIFTASNSSSGTYSGLRYIVNTNGKVIVNGQGVSIFPGSSAGSSNTGGQYV
jgi:hypothetical protein